MSEELKAPDGAPVMSIRVPQARIVIHKDDGDSAHILMSAREVRALSREIAKFMRANRAWYKAEKKEIARKLKARAN